MKHRIVIKPWGQELWFAYNDKYAGKILTIKKGHRLSLQYHRYKEETIFVDQGLLKVSHGTLNGRLTHRVLEAGSSFHVPARMVHRFEAIKTCRLIEVSTRHLWDVVRLKDDYHRIERPL